MQIQKRNNDGKWESMATETHIRVVLDGAYFDISDYGDHVIQIRSNGQMSVIPKGGNTVLILDAEPN